MQFDPNNPIVQLCAKGMEMESLGNNEAAGKLFLQAWDQAGSDFEKFTAAHYVARHQDTVQEKLKWDETALQLALKINSDTVKGALPSLYLNIAKCHEDLDDRGKAKEHYELALSCAEILPDTEYGRMIRNGIRRGLERIK